MNEKRIKLTIDPKGGVTLKAEDGFSGTSCIEATKNLEVAIGGQEVGEGKTDAFYDPDFGQDVSIEGI